MLFVVIFMFNSLLNVIIYFIFKEIWFGNDFGAFYSQSAPRVRKPAPSPRSPRPGLQDPLRFFCASGFFNLRCQDARPVVRHHARSYAQSCAWLCWPCVASATGARSYLPAGWPCTVLSASFCSRGFRTSIPPQNAS